MPGLGTIFRTFAIALALLTGAMAATAAGQVWVAGPEGTPMSLADAVSQAADGDVVEMLAGEYRGHLVLDNRRLTLRGQGKAVLQGGGKIGTAHALITVRGGDITLDSLEFRGARSADGGGAGVRLESGRLRIVLSQFFDNEHGLLAQNDEKSEITIERSVFGLAPKVVGGLYHLINIGRIGKLSITGSRFQQGFEGHLIKSRAREDVITYNFIHDSQRGGASYEIDLANGGLATVVGNVIGQGADSQNPVLVAYGTEGRAWERNVLLLAHNTFVNYGWMPAWFVRVVRDKLPENTEVHVVNNLFVGPGLAWPLASGDFQGNRHATKGMLRDIETYAFELPPGAMWRGSGVDPRNIGGHDLSPKAEYEWPVGTRPVRPDLSSWTPGAFQR